MAGGNTEDGSPTAMSKQRKERQFFSPAEKLGIVCLLAALGLCFVEVRLSALPLICFLGVSLAAPFFPAFSYYLPVISRGNPGKNAISLTFDDGPDPVATPEVLRLLERHKATASFFVTGSSAAQHPLLVKEMVCLGHTIGNHSYHHDFLVMLRSRNTLSREIESTQKELHSLGIRPLAFRPPVGATSPRLGPVLEELGMMCVNFSCRAADGGNRRIDDLSHKILSKIRAGDIVMLHDSRPKNEALLPYWINELELIVTGIRRKGLQIVPLSELIEKPVMHLSPPVP